jgi:hypothetical protein
VTVANPLIHLRLTMKYPKCFLAFAILLLGAIMGIAFQNSLFSDFLITLTGLALFLPLVLVVGVIAIIKRKIGYALVVVSSCILSLIIFSGVGGILNRWKVNAVRNYVAHAVPILDQIKARNGSYPSTLPVAVLGEPPSLLRDFGEYSSSGGDFRFEYVDEPAGWAGGEGALEFDSIERKWINDR